MVQYFVFGAGRRLSSAFDGGQALRLSPLLYLCRRLCGHFTAHGVLRDGRLSRPVSLSGLGVSIFCSLKEKRTGGGDQKVILQSVDGFSLSLSGALRRVIFSAAEDRGRQPLLDSVILSLSLLTSAMMFGNYREMWWFNLAASALYVVMWLTEFFSSGTGLSFAVMQTVVSVINIKGIVDWKKLKNDG